MTPPVLIRTLVNEGAAIPDALKALPQWVDWAYDDQGKKPPKQPGRLLNGRGPADASTGDPRTWASFADAVTAYRENPEDVRGIGFVLTKADPFTGVDLDHCRDPETGTITPWAVGIIKHLNAYTEVSPSGYGIRIIVEAKLDGLTGRKKVRKDLPSYGGEPAAIEVYDRSQYLTMTGDRLGEGLTQSAQPDPRQAEIDAFHAAIWPSAAVEAVVAAEDDEAEAVDPMAPPVPPVEASEAVKAAATPGVLAMSDYDALIKLEESGGRYHRLHTTGLTNEEGEDASSEDRALLRRLAEVTHYDSPAQVDRLFTNSALVNVPHPTIVGTLDQAKTRARTKKWDRLRENELADIWATKDTWRKDLSKAKRATPSKATDAGSTAGEGDDAKPVLKGWRAVLLDPKRVKGAREDELADALFQWRESEGDHWRFDPETETYYRYNGKTFVPIPKAVEKLKGCIDRDLSVLKAGIKEYRLGPTVKKLQRLHLTREGMTQTDANRVATANGILDLTTLKQVPHNPEALTVGMAAYDWDPSLKSADSHFISKYLPDVVFKDDPNAQMYVDTILEFAGQGLVRKDHEGRYMLDLHGPSSTGKSSVMKVLARVLGEKTRDPEGLSKFLNLDALASQDWVLQGVAAHMLFIEEVDTGTSQGRTALEILKNLASGGVVTLNPKGLESSTVRLDLVAMFCTDHELDLHGNRSNDALFRRMVRIPFNNVVPVADDNPRYIEDVIFADPLEGSRILLGLVEGYIRFKENGYRFTHQVAMDQTLNEARGEANPVMPWVSEACLTGDESPDGTTVAELHVQFTAWAAREGLGKPWRDPDLYGSRQFGKDFNDALRKLGLAQVVVKRRQTTGKRREFYTSITVADLN